MTMVLPTRSLNHCGAFRKRMWPQDLRPSRCTLSYSQGSRDTRPSLSSWLYRYWLWSWTVTGKSPISPPFHKDTWQELWFLCIVMTYPRCFTRPDYGLCYTWVSPLRCLRNAVCLHFRILSRRWPSCPAQEEWQRWVHSQSSKWHGGGKRIELAVRCYRKPWMNFLAKPIVCSAHRVGLAAQAKN